MEFLFNKWHNFSRRMKLIILALIYYVVKRMYRRLNKQSFKNKIVLVTGGAMGIGKLMCEKLQAQGAIVVIWDINESGLAEMKRKGFHTYVVDVTNRQAVFDTQKRVKNDVGVVEVLLNNAGIVVGKKLMDLTEKQIRLTMDVNCISHYWTCQSFLPDMVKRGSGHVVTISSVAGFDGLPNMSAYCASKFACRGFAESLRRELQGTGVKSTIVHPFIINTGMFHGAIPAQGFWKIFGSLLDPDYVAQEILNGIAMGKVRLLLPHRSFYLPAVGEILPWCGRDYLAKKSFGLEEGGIQDSRQKFLKD